MKSKSMKPESLMMTYGYNPGHSEGAVKAPVFQTSTFAFKRAEDGKAFFELAHGVREKTPGEQTGYIYSRINNPNLEILENRLKLWDKADGTAVFESGMAAISSVLLEFLKPGDLLLYSNPLYGGTDHFIKHFLTKIGVHSLGFMPDQSIDEVRDMIIDSGYSDKLAMVYIETPANPTNDLVNIRRFTEQIARKFSSENKKVHVAVDNTFMGPLWLHPLNHGADIVIYSATKYISGHSDLIAGAVSGNHEIISRIKKLRSMLGNMTDPHTAWLMMRSLETLKIRMDRQQKNAQKVASFLVHHPLVEKVYYLGLHDISHRDYEAYKEQCESPGAMISFDIKGGETEAFTFLNHLKLIKLAVSLGSTESLAEHPKSMTHSGVDPELLESLNVTDAMIRLSIGVESSDDIIWDIDQALTKVEERFSLVPKEHYTRN